MKTEKLSLIHSVFDAPPLQAQCVTQPRSLALPGMPDDEIDTWVYASGMKHVTSAWPLVERLVGTSSSNTNAFELEHKHMELEKMKTS